MFARLGRLVAAHPWKVIAVWIVAFAVIVPFSPSLADVTNEDPTSFLPSSDESSRAQALAGDERHRVPRQPADVARAQHRDDVRLLQRGSEADLALEPLGAQPLGQLGREYLEHDAPPEARLLGHEDAAHPAAAELALQGVGRAERVLQSVAQRVGHE